MLKAQSSMGPFWKDRRAHAVDDFVNHITEMGLYCRGNKDLLKSSEQERDGITYSFQTTLAAM